MKAFDLYFCSRSTTVNRISRAGRVIPYRPARYATCTATSTASDGTAPRATNPRKVRAGMIARLRPTPMALMIRDVRYTWKRIVSTFTAMSILA